MIPSCPRATEAFTCAERRSQLFDVAGNRQSVAESTGRQYGQPGFVGEPII